MDFEIDEFGCLVCETKFSSVADLKDHLTTAHPKSRNCGICRKAFFSIKSLNIHMNVHTRKRTFNCDFCGARRVVKWGLERHVDRVHRDRLLADVYQTPGHQPQADNRLQTHHNRPQADVDQARCKFKTDGCQDTFPSSGLLSRQSSKAAALEIDQPLDRLNNFKKGKKLKTDSKSKVVLKIKFKFNK